MRSSRRIVCLIFILAMGVWGCGEKASLGPEEEIALLDPVDDPAGWEAAARRNLYDAKVYSATVFPYTEEYSFSAGTVFDRFGAYPGESVKKGSVLAYGDGSALEEAIRKKEEQILQMEEEFEEYRRETEEALAEPAEEAKRLGDMVENLLETEPEEFLPAGDSVSGGEASGGSSGGSGSGDGSSGGSSGGSGSESGASSSVSGGNASGAPVKNPAYIQWKEFFDRYEGDYRILAHQVDIARTQLKQKTELYELDHDYAVKELERMKRELRQGILSSPAAGTVVAVGQWRNGDFVGERNKVAAIGDMDRKLLRCQYINKATMAKAKDVYALVDGRRYEIVYEPMDSEEYARRSALKETIYSTFHLAEDAEEIAVGDFAVITVVNDIRENVLSVPESALHKDGEGYYVYVMREGQSRAVSVEIGMGDGVYREILEGLQEGERVLASETMTAGEERAAVERGDFYSKFSGSGYLTYPYVTQVRNPVTYGRTYFVEYAVSLYQHVDKGEVIARIRVQPDSVELERNQVKLTRLQERLSVLERRLAEAGGGDKSLQKTIAARREEIAEVEELIGSLTADYAATQIRAPRSGVVVFMADYKPETILGRDAVLAEIAQEDNCYVILENDNQLLQYGNQVNVAYTDRDGEGKIVSGRVASLSEGGVSSGLQSRYSWISLPPEAVGGMAAAVPGENGWMSRTVFKVEGQIRRMDHVLVVPKEAVWASGGMTYVLVEEDDGSVTARSFIAGGYDATRYWVVDGLSEGMKLCLK